ncbi:MAG: type I-E CRISPR-associated protein Cas7/Cse4/CasC [Clostridiales bacterium]|jgi:CRISPR system Cascade subunit CasC|nr:type I-E CRISPR-associated protein Cas7/Cse4/CasC [Clostridiales bacterium]
MKKTVFVDLHVLQNLPPSCLNRDDTGSPKSAVYGGVRRARVSSQAWKHAMRKMFRDNFNEAELGSRTRLVFNLIADEMLKLKPDMPYDDAISKAKAILDKAKVKASAKKGDENKLSAMFFIGLQQAKNLAALAAGSLADNEKEAEKEILNALKNNNAVDVALFGRMVADNPTLNCDASAQVAHAISTHKAENEYDFFTAVDDLSPEDTSGAGHMGTVEFNSATMYRYATVAAHNLFEQLGGDTDAINKAIREFTRAFVYSLPTGKQNTFAANTIPDAVLVVVRTDRPLSFAAAFETPIRSEGIMPASAKALEKYALESYEDFCSAPQKSYIAGRYLAQLGSRLPMEQLLDTLGSDVAEMVQL